MKLTVQDAERRLSDQQRKFAEAYLENNWDYLKAARIVGMTPKGASLLLSKRSVQEFIELRLKNVGLSVEKAIARFSEMATANIGDFLDDNGEVILEKVKSHGYLVKRYKRRVSPEGAAETELELYDALAALTNVAKILGLYKDVTVNVDQRQVHNNVAFDFSKVPEDELLKLRQTFEKATIVATV